ncbi:hypothetical protein BLOT_010257 [Blomia tropicalis]|nr:hypothetical protein BLOT_015643 [Blomia tropicalis]KAI2802065.1 hypothetical protein BLOT_010257 [Blomia tropicalis]
MYLVNFDYDYMNFVQLYLERMDFEMLAVFEQEKTQCSNDGQIYQCLFSISKNTFKHNYIDISSSQKSEIELG